MSLSFSDSKTVKECLTSGTRRISLQSDSATLDAQLLLAHVLNQTRTWLLAHPEYALNKPQVSRWAGYIARLEKGEALPYILGEWEFYGQMFSVSPHVLIPRPETELLVERAIHWLKQNVENRRASEVGTGSACIAISLALALPNLNLVASDISPAALNVASTNVLRHKVENQVSLVEANLFDGIGGSFDLICANLPYIPSSRLDSLAVALREPLIALDGGADGLHIIRKFLQQSAQKLNSGGLLLAEIDDSHAQIALDSAAQHFPQAKSVILNDLAGKVRLIQVTS